MAFQEAIIVVIRMKIYRPIIIMEQFIIRVLQEFIITIVVPSFIASINLINLIMFMVVIRWEVEVKLEGVIKIKVVSIKVEHQQL
jgi:hypothetical protein